MSLLQCIYDNSNPRSLASSFRRRRMQWLHKLIDSFTPPVHILDIGGRSNFWENNGEEFAGKVKVTLINIERPDGEGELIEESMQGDARDLRGIDDDTYDIAFSNSVIEHVGDLDDQARMAKEVMRVGKACFIQTPNRYFPVEPHFVFPLWQFLPVTIRVKLHQNFDIGWFPAEPDPIKARGNVESIRLLTKSELHSLFPSAEILEETALGLTKSFVVRSLKK